MVHLTSVFILTRNPRVLAAADPYQFQWWALGLVGVREVMMSRLTVTWAVFFA